MTIADILFLTDKDTLLNIILDFQLVPLIRQYFPQILDNDTESGSEYSRLMMPSSYSGRVQREKGALTQKHYITIK
jgi:hypothetical protein